MTEPTRLAALNGRMEALKRWEATFNEKVKLLKKEEEWFHKQAAFKKARDHVLENWKQDTHGNCAPRPRVTAGV